MKRVVLPGGELAVRDEGAGPPIVLLHGFPLNHAMWDEQFASLAGSHRLIAPDLAGFGESSRFTGPLTMDRLAEDVAALLPALEVREPVWLCGLSMGGYVAWQFWRKFPERLAGLILCDTKAKADTDEARANRLRMAEHVGEHGLEYVAEAMLPKLFAPDAKTRRPDLIAAARRMILGTGSETIRAAQRGMAERPDVTEWLPQIRVPTLVVVGEADEISTPAEMRAIAAAMPSATLVVVPGAGHMAPWERPDLVSAEINRFLGDRR